MAARGGSSGASTGAEIHGDLGPRFSVRTGEWKLGRRVLSLDRPKVMGIVNLTPDSFSDGGALSSLECSLRWAEAMVRDGADLLDVGGESTRPGAAEVGADEEMRRILPFIEEASARFSVPLSVDTRKAIVAEAALEAGAQVVNDVSGLAHDPEMAEVVARSGAGVVLMHMRGTPATMTEKARYGDVVGEVLEELGEALGRARAAGIPQEAVVVDPGIGFAKTAEQSFRLLAELPRLQALGRPVLLGPSRKSFLGALSGRPPRERVAGTVAACVLGYERGARIFRVHDVAEVVDGLRVAAVMEAPR